MDMKIRKEKAYRPPFGIKMEVNVLESFKSLLEQNDKAIEIMSKKIRKNNKQ